MTWSCKKDHQYSSRLKNLHSLLSFNHPSSNMPPILSSNLQPSKTEETHFTGFIATQWKEHIYLHKLGGKTKKKCLPLDLISPLLRLILVSLARSKRM